VRHDNRLRMASICRARLAVSRASSTSIVRIPNRTAISSPTRRICRCDVLNVRLCAPAVTSKFVETLVRDDSCSRPGAEVLCVFMASIFAAASLPVHVQISENRS